MSKKSLILIAGICFVATAGLVGAQNEEPASVAADRKLPEGKQTTLGLYVTAKDAYEMWKAAPDDVTVIDVRTPEEYALIGHAEMAWNVPLGFITYQRTDGKFEHGVNMNPDFVAEVKGLSDPTATLLVMCRSGGRSAMAVNQLAAANAEDRLARKNAALKEEQAKEMLARQEINEQIQREQLEEDLKHVAAPSGRGPEMLAAKSRFGYSLASSRPSHILRRASRELCNWRRAWGCTS